MAKENAVPTLAATRQDFAARGSAQKGRRNADVEFGRPHAAHLDKL